MSEQYESDLRGILLWLIGQVRDNEDVDLAAEAEKRLQNLALDELVRVTEDLDLYDVPFMEADDPWVPSGCDCGNCDQR